MSEHELAVFFWKALIGQAIGLAIYLRLIVWSVDRKL